MTRVLWHNTIRINSRVNANVKGDNSYALHPSQNIIISVSAFGHIPRCYVHKRVTDRLRNGKGNNSRHCTSSRLLLRVYNREIIHPDLDMFSPYLRQQTHRKIKRQSTAKRKKRSAMQFVGKEHVSPVLSQHRANSMVPPLFVLSQAPQLQTTEHRPYCTQWLIRM